MDIHSGGEYEAGVGSVPPGPEVAARSSSVSVSRGHDHRLDLLPEDFRKLRPRLNQRHQLRKLLDTCSTFFVSRSVRKLSCRRPSLAWQNALGFAPCPLLPHSGLVLSCFWGDTVRLVGRVRFPPPPPWYSRARLRYVSRSDLQRRTDRGQGRVRFSPPDRAQALASVRGKSTGPPMYLALASLLLKVAPSYVSAYASSTSLTFARRELTV